MSHLSCQVCLFGLVLFLVHITLTSVFALLSGNATKICWRPLWDIVQHSPPREHPTPCHQVHVWLPGWAGRQTWHSRHGRTSHVEEQLVRNTTATAFSNSIKFTWEFQLLLLNLKNSDNVLCHAPPAFLCGSGWTWSRTRSLCLTSIRAASRTPVCLSWLRPLWIRAPLQNTAWAKTPRPISCSTLKISPITRVG